MNSLSVPFFGVMLLTSLVWCYMYAVRLTLIPSQIIYLTSLLSG